MLNYGYFQNGSQIILVGSNQLKSKTVKRMINVGESSPKITVNSTGEVYKTK